MKKLKQLFQLLLKLVGLSLLPAHIIFAADSWDDMHLSLRQKEILFQTAVHSAVVVSVDTSKCSDRSDGALITFSNGIKACAKKSSLYPDQGLISEFYSYQLQRFLGINRVPITVISQMPANSENWQVGQTLSFALFVDDLHPENMPNGLIESLNSGTLWYLFKENPEQLVQAEEWSKLIIFDYLTGQWDRLILKGLATRFEPKVIYEPIHNLYKDSDGKLVIIDHDLTFDTGYFELGDPEDRYDLVRLHTLEVRYLCHFNSDLLSKLEELNEELDPLWILVQYAEKNDPLSFADTDLLSRKFRKVFKKRIQYILHQVERCRLYKS